MKKTLKKYKMSIILSIVIVIVIVIANAIYMIITPKDDFGFHNFGYLIPYFLIPIVLTIIWIVSFIINYKKEHNSKYIILAILTPIVVHVAIVLFLILSVLFFEIQDSIEDESLSISENYLLMK